MNDSLFNKMSMSQHMSKSDFDEGTASTRFLMRAPSVIPDELCEYYARTNVYDKTKTFDEIANKSTFVNKLTDYKNHEIRAHIMKYKFINWARSNYSTFTIQIYAALKSIETLCELRIFDKYQDYVDHVNGLIGRDFKNPYIIPLQRMNANDKDVDRIKIMCEHVISKLGDGRRRRKMCSLEMLLAVYIFEMPVKQWKSSIQYIHLRNIYAEFKRDHHNHSIKNDCLCDSEFDESTTHTQNKYTEMLNSKYIRQFGNTCEQAIRVAKKTYNIDKFYYSKSISTMYQKQEQFCKLDLFGTSEDTVIGMFLRPNISMFNIVDVVKQILEYSFRVKYAIKDGSYIYANKQFIAIVLCLNCDGPIVIPVRSEDSLCIETYIGDLLEIRAKANI